MPKIAKLELQFVPTGTSADWATFEAKLSEIGYDSELYRDEEVETLQASIGPIELSAESIWQHELATTTLAIVYEFEPDGWGFLSN